MKGKLPENPKALGKRKENKLFAIQMLDIYFYFQRYKFKKGTRWQDF